MKTNTIPVVTRRTRFEPPTTNALAVNPTSPMVLQGVMQILADLNRKVDALAARPPQEVTVSPAPSVPKAPVETESPVYTTVLAKTPTPRINRLRLRDIFD